MDEPFRFTVTPTWDDGTVGVTARFEGHRESADHVLACFERGAQTVNIGIQKKEDN